MNNQQIEKNPWKAQVAKWKNVNMSANCKWILEGDKDFVDAMQTSISKSKKSKDWKDNNCLHLELFPEPFLGHPDAPIYLLGGNPGYSDNDLECLMTTKGYLDILKKSIVHEYKTSEYNDTDFGFFDERIAESEAAKWWNTHVNEKIRDKIFNIEFFAYHSKKADGLKKYFDTIDSKNPQPTCASNEYADSLIDKAMIDKKILIITRFKKYWFKRIKKLEEYRKLYVLLNHQSALVKPRNLVAYQELEELKNNSWASLATFERKQDSQ